MSAEGESPELERARRITTEALMEHLAADHISVEDFDARLDFVAAAATPAEVRSALGGLPGRGAEVGPVRSFTSREAEAEEEPGVRADPPSPRGLRRLLRRLFGAARDR